MSTGGPDREPDRVARLVVVGAVLGGYWWLTGRQLHRTVDVSRREAIQRQRRSAMTVAGLALLVVVILTIAA
jgi:TRAP-type C4-dicarboxylate transport system permease small subunit